MKIETVVRGEKPGVKRSSGQWRVIYSPNRPLEDFFSEIVICETCPSGMIFINDGRPGEQEKSGWLGEPAKWFGKYGKPNQLLLETAKEAGINLNSVEVIKWWKDGRELIVLNDRNVIFTAWAGLEVPECELVKE